jgi:small GTP-binding protein
MVLASSSYDKTIRLWNPLTGEHLRTLQGHADQVIGAVWSPDGEVLASCSLDKTIRLWNPLTGEHLRTLQGRSNSIYCLAWSPDGTLLAGDAGGTPIIHLWNPLTGEHLSTLKGETDPIYCLAWSPDGTLLAAGSPNATICLWNPLTGKHLSTLKGHTGAIHCLAWSPDGSILASGSFDNTICLWNPLDGSLIHILEGHTGQICGISFSWKHQIFASISQDSSVRIWNTDTWETCAFLEERYKVNWRMGFAFHPDAPVLASVGEQSRTILIWDLDIDTILNTTPSRHTIHYTTAKIALVGDSGVGKTGLGYRIAEGTFQATESTHGQQFWIIDDLGTTRADGTQCEAILWDFAGQPNFRPIHALFLDDIDLALVLFDPSRPDTFISVEYWLKQLSHRQQLCHTILIVARTDVSKLAHSLTELETFCRERNISGSFIMTSAKTGDGVADLLERIKRPSAPMSHALLAALRKITLILCL